jgi:hypothetical protein
VIQTCTWSKLWLWSQFKFKWTKTKSKSLLTNGNKLKTPHFPMKKMKTSNDSLNLFDFTCFLSKFAWI